MSLISKHVLLGFASLGFVSLIRGFHLRSEYSQTRKCQDLGAVYRIILFDFSEGVGRYEYGIRASVFWSIVPKHSETCAASMFTVVG
jgi:hypothetical protein